MNGNACGDIVSRCGTVSGSGGTTTTDAGGPTDPGVTTCQFDCDSLLGRECITAAEQSTCRTKCTSASSSSRDTFQSCSNEAPDCSTAHDCFSTFTN